jgi:hypothetical protein
MNTITLIVVSVVGLSSVVFLAAEWRLRHRGRSVSATVTKLYSVFVLSLVWGMTATKAIVGPYFWVFFPLFLLGVGVSVLFYRAAFVNSSEEKLSSGEITDANS